MNKPSYSELLKHPLWQKKRLEVLQRAGFTCEVCRTKEDTLHVHHGYYERNKMPWEYPLESLHCLCESCHDYAQKAGEELRRLIALLPIDELVFLTGYVSGRLMCESIPHRFAVLYKSRVLEGIATALNGNPLDYEPEIQDGVITCDGADYAVAWADWQAFEASLPEEIRRPTTRDQKVKYAAAYEAWYVCARVTR